MSSTPGQHTGAGSYSRGAMFGVASFVATALVSVASSIAVARAYGIEVIGEFALVSAPLSFVWYLSTVREQPALVRHLAGVQPRDPKVNGAFVATLTLSSALTVAACVVVGAVSVLVLRGPLDQPDLVVPAIANLAFYLLLTNPSWNLDTIFTAFVDGRRLFWIRLHQVVVFLAAALALSAVSLSVWCLIGATALSWGTSLAHRVWSVRAWMEWQSSRATRREGFGSLPSIVRFGLKLAPGYMAGGIAREAPIWILGSVSTVSAVGAYSRAWSLAQRFVDFTHRLSEMLFPTLLARRSSDLRAGFDVALWDSIRYGGVIMAFPAAVGGGAAESVMGLFGPGFAQGATALAVLLAFPLVFVLTELQGQGMMARNRPWVPTAAAVVGAAASIAGTFIGADAHGATGAAAGFLAGTLLRLLLQTFVSARDTPGLSRLVPLRQLIGWAMACVMAFVAARLVDDAVEPLLAGLALAGTAGTVAYVVGVLLLAGSLPRDRERVRQLLQRRGQPAYD